ncbi:hypothetical protein E2C01_057849 [Portunus trituberculatus]|uniref:Uncharacterized protein n=1 Tax=Portunus trituberculatus TaxID=210409 RepID=A0A5B7H1L3_PORTR|nr:hypothetical protein [Portunus trituberculatus]
MAAVTKSTNMKVVEVCSLDGLNRGMQTITRSLFAGLNNNFNNIPNEVTALPPGPEPRCSLFIRKEEDFALDIKES